MGNDPIYEDKTIELGKEIAKRGMDLVYGGGNRGLMGVLAHSVTSQGRRAIGVLPESMNIDRVLKGSAHTQLIITHDMHERKRTMYEISDAFIAIPGGIGTIEEIMEIYTWKQLGYHKKNVALFNPLGYWNPLVKMLDKAEDEGFLTLEAKSALIVEEYPKILIDRLLSEKQDLPEKI